MMEENNENLLNYLYAKLREAPKLSQDYIKRDGKLYQHRKAYYRIKEHIDDFINGDDENRFLIMPGLRGVGKTTILLQLYDYLLNEKRIEQDKILYFSSDELNLYLNARIIDLIGAFVDEIHQNSMVNIEEQLFIFIDEAHYDQKWSEAGKIIYDQTRKIFMVFTGSSALSLEMNVDAARRVTKEKVFPLSFPEYLSLKNDIIIPLELADSLRELIWKGNDKSLKDALINENKMNKSLLRLNRPIKNEWEDFLYGGGFPFALRLDQSEMYERIFSIVNRIVDKDVFSLKSFNTETRSTISRVITFLAMQKPGGTSDAKLADRIGVSPTLIRTILDILEKTQLIFNVKPYGGAGKIVRKSWKYYFLSSSLNAALNFKLGKYDVNNREFRGVLAENMVASHFFRLMETENILQSIFYSSEKAGADFLLYNAEDDLIPVEVGLGKKKTGQLKRSIRNYDCNHGILLSGGFGRIGKEDNIIHIPLITFSFL
jgi:predicted AAA+ superfamily ATPase